MAFVKIFDSTRNIEVTIMPDVFKFNPKIKRDDIYIFSIITTKYKTDLSYGISKMEKMVITDEK
jgi:hypothetical protein